MIVLTSTAGGSRTAQIKHSASWLQVSKPPSGGRAGRALPFALVG
jgi:hypothetical protein